MTDQEATAIWTLILDDFGQLVADIWERSTIITGLSGARDSRILSVQLFKRLRDSRNAFVMLWKAHLNNEAETLVRNAVEAAICLASLRANPPEFMEAFRSDAAFTLTKQAPIWFSRNPQKGVEAGMDATLMFGQRRPDGTKHGPLNWQALAEGAGVEQLYACHRYLSGTVAHITGISLLSDIEFVEPLDNQLPEELRTLRRLDAIKQLCSAVHTGIICHAATVDMDKVEARAAALMERMVAAR